MKKLALVIALIGTVIMFGCSKKKIQYRDLETRTEVLIPGEIYASPILENRYSCDGKLLREKKFMGMDYTPTPDRLEYQNVTISGQELHNKGYRYVGDNPDATVESTTHTCGLHCEHATILFCIFVLACLVLLVLWLASLIKRNNSTPPAQPVTQPVAPAPQPKPDRTMKTEEVIQLMNSLSQNGGGTASYKNGSEEWNVTISGSNNPQTATTPKKEQSADKGPDSKPETPQQEEKTK